MRIAGMESFFTSRSKRVLCTVLGLACLVGTIGYWLEHAAAQPPGDPPLVEQFDSVTVEGDSSSGAVITHVDPGETTVINVVSPYHHYRVPMESVALFSNTGEDEPIVPEIGTVGDVVVVSGPTALDESVWTVTVAMPEAEGNWIATFRTQGVSYKDAWGRELSSPRTVQLRLSTRPPLEEIVSELNR